MQIVQQFFLGVLFIIFAFISFTPIFLLLLKKIKNDLDNLERFVIATVLGMVVFTIFAYFLAAISLRFLIWTLPLSGILILLRFKESILHFKIDIKNKAFFWAVLIIGIIGQVAVNAPSGFFYDQGIYFWSSHGHDGLWHVALMEHMQTDAFPFQNPELAGYKLQNYHFFVDLLMSEFSRILPFSSLDTYFRFMPTVFSFLLGLSSFIFVKAWSKRELAGIWAMVFVYFTGSFGYILTLINNRRIAGEALFWVSQTQSVLGNPPHAAAFIITIAFLICLLKYLNTKNKLFFGLCILLGGVVIEFKIYAGTLILGGLFFIAIYELIFRKSFNIFLLFVLTFILAFLIYYPNSSNSQEFLIWEPWWFIRTMVVATDRLNWLDLELKRQTYIAESNWKRVVQVEATAFIIFLVGNLGMRFLGFWTIIKQIKIGIITNSFNIFFLLITLASFFIPVFFLQKGVAWNAIQFNQYFLLFFGFLAAIAVDDLIRVFKKKYTKIFLGISIIILAVPTQIGLLLQFYTNSPLSKVSYTELAALNYLKNNSKDEDIILTAPFNSYEKDKYKQPPIPIYAWYDTGYVSAFSNRKTLLSDEEQVTIMGYNAQNLFRQREGVFKTQDADMVNNYLKTNKIDYIYLVWGQSFSVDINKLNIDLIFENENAKVYSVRKSI